MKIWLQYSVPISESMLEQVPNVRNTFSTRFFAIVMASLLGIGMQIKNFVRLHMTVIAYLFLFSLTVNGPIVSTERESNGFSGVSVMHIGSFVFARALLILHSWQESINSAISCDMVRHVYIVGLT